LCGYNIWIVEVVRASTSRALALFHRQDVFTWQRERIAGRGGHRCPRGLISPKSVIEHGCTGSENGCVHLVDVRYSRRAGSREETSWRHNRATPSALTGTPASRDRNAGAGSPALGGWSEKSVCESRPTSNALDKRGDAGVIG